MKIRIKRQYDGRYVIQKRWFGFIWMEIDEWSYLTLNDAEEALDSKVAKIRNSGVVRNCTLTKDLYLKGDDK